MSRHFGFAAVIVLLVLTFGTLCYVGHRELGIQAQLRIAVADLQTEKAQTEAVRGSFDEIERLYQIKKREIADLKSDAVVYVDECNIRGEFPNTEDLGKAYPHIIIDGVRCDYDPEQKWFVHAALRCRVMWMGIGDGKILMDRVDFRDHEGEPYENKDGDILVEMQPLKIMEKGKWRTLKAGDPIHKYAATYLGLQKTKDATPERDTLSRLGNSDYWAEFDGETWKLADTSEFPDDVKAGLGGGVPATESKPVLSGSNPYDADGNLVPSEPNPLSGPDAADAYHGRLEPDPPKLVAITYDTASPADQTAMRLAAVQAQYDELISRLNIVDGQISEKSKELSALLKERKRIYDHAPTLRKAIDLLTVEKPE